MFYLHKIKITFSNKIFKLYSQAHCVYGRSSDPSLFTIGIGYWNRNQLNAWSETKTVTRIIIHESYVSFDTGHDIALMKLDVKF